MKYGKGLVIGTRHGLDDSTCVRSLGVAIWPYLHPSISTALMRPRRGDFSEKSSVTDAKNKERLIYDMARNRRHHGG